jgi:hypothetical protein
MRRDGASADDCSVHPTFSLGRVAGVEIGINWSWVIVFALIVWSLAATVFPGQNPDRGTDGKVATITLPSAPVMLLEDAVERLNLSGEQYVFFVEPQTRHGNVLYRRYDGHYGLIDPEAVG